MNEDHFTNLISLPFLILIFAFISGGFYCLPIFGCWTYLIYKIRKTSGFYFVWIPLLLLTLVFTAMLGHLIYSLHASLLNSTGGSGGELDSSWPTTKLSLLPNVAKSMLMFSITASPILAALTFILLLMHRHSIKAKQ